jgi:hypothetical protein
VHDDSFDVLGNRKLLRGDAGKHVGILHGNGMQGDPERLPCGLGLLRSLGLSVGRSVDLHETVRCSRRRPRSVLFVTAAAAREDRWC